MVDKRSVLTVAILVGGIAAVLYPIAVAPLLKKANEQSSTNLEPNNRAAPGFRKSSHWSEVQRGTREV